MTTPAAATEGASRAADAASDAAEAAPPTDRLTLWQRLTGEGGATPDGWVRPSPGFRALRTDVPIALLVVGVMVLSERFNAFAATLPGSERYGYDSPLFQGAPWAIVVVPMLFAITIAIRRIAPIGALTLGVAAFVVGQVAPYPEFFLTQVACFIAIYSAGAWSRMRWLVTVLRLAVLAGFVLWTAISVALGVMFGSAADFGPGYLVFTVAFTTVINVLYVLAATLFGSNDYRRAGQRAALATTMADLADRTAALEAERRVVAEQAVRLDRVEIARELHDVVAHHVSLMGLQAAAARRSLAASPDAPERAERALLAVEDSARSAITELQQMLTTLRSSDAAVPGPGPGPGDGGDAGDPGGVRPATVAPSTRSIEQVPELVEQVRDAGMSVSLHTVGEARPLPTTVGFTAYRIVQEALTNARKHGGERADVDVRLRYLRDRLELDVTNAVPIGARAGARAPVGGAEATGEAGGRGLLGMRERALAVGGTFDAGPSASGGFRVVASLPAPPLAADASSA